MRKFENISNMKTHQTMMNCEHNAAFYLKPFSGSGFALRE